ncbi:hypothetical protein [Bradyrhizobium sp. RT6a]|uniref:hypothetical protein n=1 Tax=unclassified Bradyrhizobium TaxID=2631580 RepID=UPI003398EC30
MLQLLGATQLTEGLWAGNSPVFPGKTPRASAKVLVGSLVWRQAIFENRFIFQGDIAAIRRRPWAPNPRFCALGHDSYGYVHQMIGAKVPADLSP